MPSISRLFKKNNKTKIGTNQINTPHNNKTLIDEARINSDNLISNNDEFIFTSQQDILNLFGAHYQRINSPSYLNDNTRLKTIVDSSIEKFISEMENDARNNITITKFSNSNLATQADTIEEYKYYFTSIPKISLIF